MALALQACWKISILSDRLVGELCASKSGDSIVLTVGPDRYHSLGGPFSSVRDYLHAYIRSSLDALQKQQGIDEYKERFLSGIINFVEGGMHKIPIVMEDVPIVAMHSDMGLHNIILSPIIPTDIKAVIDWEFVASAPYASLHRMIEMLFRKPALNDMVPNTSTPTSFVTLLERDSRLEEVE
jgi:hypothetical protein